MSQPKKHTADGMRSRYEGGETWAVTIDRPYYPSVDYFGSELEACNYAERIRTEENDGPEATHETTVCVMKIVSAHKIRTHY